MVSDMIPLLATTVQKAKVCFEVAYAITRWYSVPAAGAPSSAARVSLIGQPRGAGRGGAGCGRSVASSPLPNTSNWLAYTSKGFPLKCILIVITYNRLLPYRNT